LFRVSVDWNPKQQQLREALSDSARFEEAMRICKELHGIVHASAVSSGAVPSVFDEVWENIDRKATIAWNIWHITRIEDLTVNILVANGAQVLDEAWLERLGTTVRDTGNAMSDPEAEAFSLTLNRDALRAYRTAVGLRTREILDALAPGDLKRKFPPESLARIKQEGGVTEHKDSVWLLDFWGRKTVAGILLMPVTRHQIVHLSSCVRKL